jgi:hypothetical protein
MKIVHTGHIGDIIAFLPLYFKVGGEALIIRDDRGMAPMSGFKYDTLEPLLKSQGIRVFFMNGCIRGAIHLDMGDWRQCYQHHISLTDCQARYMGLVDRNHGHFKLDKPWLKVEPDPLTEGRVIFNRTPRYRNPAFPWKKVAAHFGERALFVGTPDEHELYEKEVGAIERYETKDCLAVAKAIEGADFFVGNQSSSFWIAAGLRKPLLQEVDCVVMNSIVPYEGAQYAVGGEVDFSKL